MSIREFLPKDIKSVVRVLVILIVLKVILNAVSNSVPVAMQPYMPNLG